VDIEPHFGPEKSRLGLHEVALERLEETTEAGCLWNS
jgi:hypothetical protein